MFNEALAEMKRTGKYDQIVNKYIKDGSATAEKGDSVSEKGIIGILKNNYGVLLSGLLKTIGLALLSFAFALILGVIIGLMAVSHIKGFRVFASVYVDIIRGKIIFCMVLLYGKPKLRAASI